MAGAVLDGPFGRLRITEAESRLTRIRFGGAAAAGEPTPLLAEALRQFRDYFAGRREGFDLPLAPAEGLDEAFRAALLAIPFGETRTYGDLAKELGESPQAIGRLCGANPLPILVPCHRVLAQNGLGGYSGGAGIETKVALLKHEGAASLLI